MEDGYPLTITKLKMLLVAVSARLQAPSSVEVYVRAARLRGARIRWFAVRFVSQMLRIKVRAVARVQARYAPMNVVRDPVTNLPISATAPPVILNELAADDLLGDLMEE